MLIQLKWMTESLHRHTDIISERKMRVKEKWDIQCDVVKPWQRWSAYPPKVRLVNGVTNCEGRVEVEYNGSWGTVCDDEWDMVDAMVVCRQLDCGPPLAVVSSSHFGQGTGLIVLDNVNCTGPETDLSKCRSHGWGVHNCYHYEDAAVICRGEAVTVYEHKLAEVVMNRVFMKTDGKQRPGRK